MDYYFFCKVFLMVFLSGVSRSQIIKAPNNQIVSSSDTAVFNCSMSCSQPLPVTWYFTLPTNGRTVAVSPYTSLSQVKTIYGVEVARGMVNECSQGGYRVEQLFVKANLQLNLMPVQCSILCMSGDCSCDTTQVYFSKLAILNVLEGSSSSSSVQSSTKTTSTALPTPMLSPSPSLQDRAAVTTSSGVTSYVTITLTTTATATLSSAHQTLSPLQPTEIPSQTSITSK